MTTSPQEPTEDVDTDPIEPNPPHPDPPSVDDETEEPDNPALDDAHEATDVIAPLNTAQGFTDEDHQAEDRS
jgi:hypothetical protein